MFKGAGSLVRESFDVVDGDVVEVYGARLEGFSGVGQVGQRVGAVEEGEHDEWAQVVVWRKLLK
jgi:hypothetical protein